MKGCVDYVPLGGGVVSLQLNNAPMNTLASGVRAGLQQALGRAQADGECRAAVVCGAAPGPFCAGAEISEFAAGSKRRATRQSQS